MKKLLIGLLACFPLTAFCVDCPCNSVPIPPPGTIEQVLKACGPPDRKVNLTVDPRNVGDKFRDPAIIKYQSEVERSLRPEEIPPRKVLITKFSYQCPKGVLNFQDGILAPEQEGI